jgi:uncharacterized protein YbjQ (UPF0145 family)
MGDLTRSIGHTHGMATEEVFYSTTDTIPHKRDKLVNKSEVTWVYDAKSISGAYNRLGEWSKEHGYDAVVGVRFMVVHTDDGLKYSAYGTAISWEY